VAVARLDQVSKPALHQWKEHYAMRPAHEGREGVKTYFIDGKNGAGISALKREALSSGKSMSKSEIE